MSYNLNNRDLNKVVKQVLQALEQQTKQQPQRQAEPWEDVYWEDPSTQNQPQPPVDLRSKFAGEIDQLTQMICFQHATRAISDFWIETDEHVNLQDHLLDTMLANIMEAVEDVKQAYEQRLTPITKGDESSALTKSKIDVLILVTAWAYDRWTRPDVLNSLAHMGYLGECLARDLFNATVAELMAPDQKDAKGKSIQNKIRRKALNDLQRHIEDFHVDLLTLCTDKRLPQIPNPQQIKAQPSTAFMWTRKIPNQTELPF